MSLSGEASSLCYASSERNTSSSECEGQTLQARGGAEREGGCRLAPQTITRTGWVSIPQPGEGQGRRRGGHSCPKCPRPKELPKGWELCSEMKKSPGDQLQAKPLQKLLIFRDSKHDPCSNHLGSQPYRLNCSAVLSNL